MRRSVVALLALGLSSCGLASCGTGAGHDGPGAFVLGVDGMDPKILQRLIDEGRMPNFAALANDGSFQELGTSNPPQSPVAWSTFVTGTNPGGHGVYDFVHRDPKTYLPTSSATSPVHDVGSAVELFGYKLPYGGDVPENNRSGTPWWDLLHDAGVDVEVYRVPGNYPPTPSDAKVLSGMGTVDMRGGYGVYTWYTDVPLKAKGELKGDIQLVTVSDDDLDGTPETVSARLKGPPDLFHLDPGQLPGENDYLSVPVRVVIDAEADVALVTAGDEQAVVREGEWTDWMTVSFDALPGGAMPLEGTVRFFVKELRPTFQVYASPVNISAANPAQDVSTPSDFATRLYDAVGHFYTQGMPEETNALKDGTFSDDDYIGQVGLVQEDTRDMLEVALARFERGDATFFYVSDIDLQCHMLWRHGDPKYPGAPPHPAYDAATAPAHEHDIERFYTDVDTMLGRIRQELPADTRLIVMSDHGFEPYSRKVNLNAWLRDNGWLVLKDGKRTGHIAHGDVDWSRTKAYGLGFNALYFNLAGREAEGIVKPEEVPALTAQLREQLKAATDPESGLPLIFRVDTAAEVYSGPRVGDAPDLVVGYQRGFGCSDESTLGEILDLAVEDNTSRWSGSHLIAPDLVPGVILANRPIDGAGHGLPDVTATLLAHFGVAPAPGMEGSPLFTP